MAASRKKTTKQSMTNRGGRSKKKRRGMHSKAQERDLVTHVRRGPTGSGKARKIGYAKMKKKKK